MIEMANLNNYEPPTGCAPYYVTAADRIAELSRAITRHAEYINDDHDKIAEWADEIMLQCELIKILKQQ